jgi:hypothetical protein
MAAKAEKLSHPSRDIGRVNRCQNQPEDNRQGA